MRAVYRDAADGSRLRNSERDFQCLPRSGRRLDADRDRATGRAGDDRESNVSAIGREPPLSGFKPCARRSFQQRQLAGFEVAVQFFQRQRIANHQQRICVCRRVRERVNGSSIAAILRVVADERRTLPTPGKRDATCRRRAGRIGPAGIRLAGRSADDSYNNRRRIRY